MPKGPRGESRPADLIRGAVKVMRIATGEDPDDGVDAPPANAGPAAWVADMTSEPDLADEIVKFIESLPATISVDVMLLVAIYVGNLREGGGPSKPEEFLPAVLEALAKSSGYARMGATLRTVAALDHALLRTVQNIRQVAGPLQQAQNFPAGLPMRQHLYERAYSDWVRLRDTVITPQALVDYEDTLMWPKA
jgi:hypothetical protein